MNLNSETKQIKSLFEKYPIISQFAKFAFVGFINTGIDFAILNLLMWMSGIYKGGEIIFLNAISFTVAAVNSYLMNKYWTFRAGPPASSMTESSTKSLRAGEKKEIGKEFVQFISISLIGILINTGIVYSVTTLIEPFFGFSTPVWANFAKAAATGVSLIWNFLGYKFIVFKK